MAGEAPVFNYGENYNIKGYFVNGERMYSRVSGIKEGITTNGLKYQYLKSVDERGGEFVFVLYEDGQVRILSTNSFSQTKGDGIALYP